MPPTRYQATMKPTPAINIESQPELLRSCVIFGTDTGSGKTHCSVQLLKLAHRLGYAAVGMKPVATGWNPNTPKTSQEDVAALLAHSRPHTGKSTLNEWHNPYLFAPPISPHLAAQQAGCIIEPKLLQTAFSHLQAASDIVIVESAGGVLSPLSDTLDMADLAMLLNLPALLVVDMKLGCINQARLASHALLSRGIRIKGWIANYRTQPDEADAVHQSLATYLPFPEWQLPYQLPDHSPVV